MKTNIDFTGQPFTKETLFDLLDGFHAYDEGCLDSGIRDEKRKSEVKTFFESLDDKTLNALLFEFLETHYINDECVQAGYSLEDVQSFCEWFNDYSRL